MHSLPAVVCHLTILTIFWFPCPSVSKRVSVKNHLNVNVSIFIQIQLIFIWEVLHLGFAASSIFLKIWFLKCSLHEEFSTLYLIIQGMLQLSPSFLQWNNYLSKCKVHFQTDGNNSAKMTEVRWFRFSPSCLLFFFFFFRIEIIPWHHTHDHTLYGCFFSCILIFPDVTWFNLGSKSRGDNDRVMTSRRGSPKKLPFSRRSLQIFNFLHPPWGMLLAPLSLLLSLSGQTMIRHVWIFLSKT